MIYRKWSLLAGPVAILGGITAAFVTANYLFVENEWLQKTQGEQQDTAASTK